RAKSDFLANMSHEMRTPLNAVIGMTALGRNAADPERREYCLARIEEASKHLLGVINNVLDYSKIEADKLELVETEFIFEEMLKKVCGVITFKAAEKELDFNVRIDVNIPRTLVGDEQHLTQVITNLLSNAVKFTPEKGRITLSAILAGEKDGRPLVRIEVEDTGIGVSEEQKSRLFRSFEQADNTITKRFGGTGLGLAISKHIIEKMGGEVTLESQIDQGSIFAVTVPLQEGSAAAAPDTADGQKWRVLALDGTVETKPDTGEKQADDRLLHNESSNDLSCNNPSSNDLSDRRILLVDDVEINREIVMAMLEPTNAAIDCAENGAEALKMFSDAPERYDLILMDIQMPEMDGYQATRSIRALDTPRGQTVPIIAMTANAFRDDIERALAAGMNAHMAKPIDFNGLIGKLSEYL
ncbi:MAG: ATP-binding protein, partial [Oscillospiraceae bacterium]|nr:ATP-binding protein [Oscillospiraceae bacterium]